MVWRAPPRRAFVGFIDEFAPGELRRWVTAVAALAAVGYAAGVWVNALVEPWAWSRRGPELAVVLTALVVVGLARRQPLTAALLLLAVAFVELHASFLVYGVTGASKVITPTMIAATGFLLGGVAAYLAAGLSTLLLCGAAVFDGVLPGVQIVEVEHLFYAGIANAAVAVITVKGLEVMSSTARRAEASRRATSDLIRHAPDGIVVLDGQHRIVTANPAAGLLLRETPQMLEGRRLDALSVRIEVAGEEAGALPLDNPDGSPIQVQAVSPDGRVRHLEFTARSFPRSDGTFLTLIVLRDITDRIEAAEREARLGAHMQRTQRHAAVAQLAGGLAHDFNNIFTVIRGAAELLQVDAEDDPDGIRESAEVILEVQERGAALIRQLLAYARPAGEEVETFTVADELRQLTPILQGLLGERISLSLDVDARGAVSMDRQSFRQVVFNLLTNARDAMPSGGDVTVSVVDPSGGEESPWLRLTVRDTGEGMAADTVERIFEPFFTTRLDSEHSGLGLATVQSVVNGVDGSVRVDSTPGEGTSIHVLLPVATSEDPVVVAEA